MWFLRHPCILPGRGRNLNMMMTKSKSFITQKLHCQDHQSPMGHIPQYLPPTYAKGACGDSLVGVMWFVGRASHAAGFMLGFRDSC